MIRIKLIGLGNRGLRTLERFKFIPQEEACFTQLVDVDPACVEAAHAIYHSEHEGENYDLAYICTDWKSHARLAIEEMLLGKDVAVEVPAALTLEECRRLRDVARHTGRRCMMMENCCFDSFHLACMEMARQGLFGTLTHLEGAYIHTLGEHGDPTKPWMLQAIQEHNGNTYPTHGFGPIAQLLALDGDAIDSSSIVSMSSSLATSLNTALIRSQKGRSVLLQLDVCTPRPYSRMQTICGTEGFAQKYPVPTLWLKGMQQPVTGQEALTLAEQYLVGPLAEYWKEGHRLGVPNEMNYTMDRQMLHCLKSGERFDIEVEEAVEWSSLIELTERAAQNK